MGPTLHQAVIKARAAPPTPATPTPPSGGGVSSISTPLPLPTPTPTISRPQTPQISSQSIRQGSSLLTAGVINSNSNSSGSGSENKIQRQPSLTQSGIASGTSNAQKYVIVTQRPSTPSGMQSSSGIVKYQTSATQVSLVECTYFADI